jgi:very-short-patch-repair endonuclease
MTITKNIPQLKQYRRNLRKNMTQAEVALWIMIKNKQLGERFLRQYSIDNCIVDFYCPKFKLAIKLDGEQHFSEYGIEKDEKRDAYLKSREVIVLRFENFEILEYPQRTLEEIKRYLCATPPSERISLR